MVRRIDPGAAGVVKLFEDPSIHGLIAAKFFDSDVTRLSGGSSAFVREIDRLVLVTHPCFLRIVGYCLATRRARTHGDTGKAIVIVGIVLGEEFIIASSSPRAVAERLPNHV
jgi:hypothetical protein